MDFEVVAGLVERSKQGDFDSFAELYISFSKSVYFIGFGITKNEEDANDVVQETMITLFENLATIEDNKSAVAYINRVARNHAVDILRKRRPMESIDDADFHGHEEEETNEEFLPEAYAEQKEQREILMSVIDELTDSLRAAVFMYYYQDIPMKEIAEFFNVSEITIRVRLSRARDLIKEKLEKNKDFVRCAVPLSVLSRALHAQADEVFTPEKNIELWQRIAQKLGRSAEEIEKTTAMVANSAGLAAVTSQTAVTSAVIKNAMIQKASSSAITAMIIATCGAALLGAGAMVYQTLNSSPAETYVETAIHQPIDILHGTAVYDTAPLAEQSTSNLPGQESAAAAGIEATVPLSSDLDALADDYVLPVEYPPDIAEGSIIVGYSPEPGELPGGGYISRPHEEQATYNGEPESEIEIETEPETLENAANEITTVPSTAPEPAPAADAPPVQYAPSIPNAPNQSEQAVLVPAPNVPSNTTQNVPQEPQEPQEPHAPALPQRPVVTVANSRLSYPVGSVVTEQQILQDAGFVVSNKPGRSFEASINDLDGVDFGTPNRYIVHVQVTEGGVLVLQRVLVVDVVEV